MDDNGPNPGSDRAHAVHIIQTPLGIIRVALDYPATPGEPDPLSQAIDTFQTAVSEGAANPLGEALSRLKEMAYLGRGQPLIAGLALLKRMADDGMLPSMEVLLQDTGVTQDDVAESSNSTMVTILADDEHDRSERPSMIEKLDEDETDLN
ncbi:MAG: hypothetical protein OEY28_07550 [Nitrospira sp.]|nr:hypothetical protein [Nitrospira sp.]